MMMLEPRFILMDETDSGLDVDALRIVADGVNKLRSPDRGMLIITHYQRLLDYIVPDRCLLYTSPSPRDRQKSRMPSSA